MTPPLPTEMLQEILSLALLDEPAVQRQQTRLAFGSVCRAWRASTEVWKTVEVVHPDQLFGLVLVLIRSAAEESGADPVGARVRNLHIELGDGADGGVVRRTQGDLDRLLRLLPSLTRLDMVVSQRSLVDPDLCDREHDEDHISTSDWLGRAIGPGLASLRTLVHFTLRSKTGSGDKPYISGTWLKKIVASWTALETIELDDCYIGHPEDDDSLSPYTIWRHHPHLRAVGLRSFNTSDVVEPLLSGLPATVRALAVTDDSLFTHSRHHKGFARRLGRLPADLVELKAVDHWRTATHRCQSARGQWDNLIAPLTRLRKLTISVCALSDLSATLGALAGLEELELVQNFCTPDTPVGHEEVAAFLRRASGLRQFGLGRDIWTKWLPAQVRAVEQEAEREAVRLHLRCKPEREWPYLGMTPDSSDDEGDSNEDDGDEDEGDDEDHDAGDGEESEGVSDDQDEN